MTYELRFERLINAERGLVFDLFTEQAGQVAFYQQGEATWIVRSECELRVGGVWRIEFGPSEDEIYRHRHVFKVVDRPLRLVMGTTEIRPDGFSFDTETEIRFDEQGTQTLMTVRQSGFLTEQLRDEHTVGLPEAFAQFERFVIESSRNVGL
ncbi:MAG: SRPBCC domain-containing protein [Chloroflexi bacterium]|nr:SRPBCC domain-containing protein [Chloroflexota bacterium]